MRDFHPLRALRAVRAVSWAAAACLLTCAAALGSAGCRSNDTPDVVLPPAVDTERAPVDPAVDAWFRSTDAQSAATLQPGDRISITLQGLPEYSVTRDIPPDGSVPLYRAPRSVDARGKTPQQLETEIAAVYSESVKAYVTVSLVASAPRVVYVAGAVHNQQAFQMRPGENLTVLQALTLAGGPTPDADLLGVTIMRMHPGLGRVVSSAPLDIEGVQMRGDQHDNLSVLPGDTIVVPVTQERQVHVLGMVERPGPVRWYRGLTVSRVVTEVGGFKKFARTEAIRVVRGGREALVFDFTDLVSGAVTDLVLEPGDVVYVDEKWF